MIGYYVHHQGRGHLHRARALAATLDVEVAGLSSLERPAGWRGPWIQLPRDDDHPPHREVTAAGRLHWAPLGHRGQAARAARVSRWIEQSAPQAVVVDVSVEMVLLCRLHGVPVISVVLPGCRDDAPHRLGFDIAEALVGFWPDGDGRATTTLLPAVPAEVRDRVRAVGALARYPVAEGAAPVPHPRGEQRRVTVLLGSGGDVLDRSRLARMQAQAPGWAWTVLGGDHAWVEDPREAVAGADVVLTHAGQNALAEVAALRRPAVVVPQRRPFDEQHCTAVLLAHGPWPATVLPELPENPAAGWGAVLAATARLDGGRWEQWCDGGAAARFAAVVDEVLAAAA